MKILRIAIFFIGFAVGFFAAYATMLYASRFPVDKDFLLPMFYMFFLFFMFFVFGFAMLIIRCFILDLFGGERAENESKITCLLKKWR